MKDLKTTYTVDATGLQCPMPLLKAKQALNKVSSGEVVEVLATDSGSVKDFGTYANISGHKLLLSEQSDNVYRYLIEKS